MAAQECAPEVEGVTPQQLVTDRLLSVISDDTYSSTTLSVRAAGENPSKPSSNSIKPTYYKMAREKLIFLS